MGIHSNHARWTHFTNARVHNEMRGALVTKGREEERKDLGEREREIREEESEKVNN